jgi:hypothetical protein
VKFSTAPIDRNRSGKGRGEAIVLRESGTRFVWPHRPAEMVWFHFRRIRPKRSGWLAAIATREFKGCVRMSELDFV